MATDSEWHTYQQLADLWDLKLTAAKARVRRARYQRVIGNDGVVKVSVPPAALQATTPTTVRATLSSTLPTTVAATPLPQADNLLVAELRRQITELRAQVAKTEQRTERAEAALLTLQGHLGVSQKNLATALEIIGRPWWKRIFGS
jgi:hypothetical protein